MNKYKKLMVITAMTAALGTSAFAASTGITDISNYWGKAAIQYFYNQHYISASAKALGLPQSSPPDLSAIYSRERDTAI